MDVRRDCTRLVKKINESNFNPDCIVYIKSGAYLVGKEMSQCLNIKFKGLRITRLGNGGKEKMKFILKVLPKSVKYLLREFEFKSGIHKKGNRRFVKDIDSNLVSGKNILLVDDSVDTGNTISFAIDFLKKNYGQDLIIKVAALNKFKISENIINTDYYIYEDSIIIYPWSKDSKQYEEFINIYNSN